jgi:hypothetical protein
MPTIFPSAPMGIAVGLVLTFFASWVHAVGLVLTFFASWVHAVGLASTCPC